MDKIKVMVNGLPGKMATKVAEHIAKSEDLELIKYSLTGPEIEGMQKYSGIEGYIISLIEPKHRFYFRTKIKNIFGAELSKDFISVDYTHPSAVNENAEFYCSNGLNFVMGTTGGDRKKLEEDVKKSKICAVIAPNMAKQIVAFQAMIEYAAKTFPDVFKGYKLEIKESHQKGKADTSGTAKAMVNYFNKLGIPFSAEQIIMIRDPEEQKKMGVPDEYLGGHGWHTYTLKSADDTVLFEFTHNVNGRDIYAAGTIDAIRYLDEKIKQGYKGRVYSMADVS